MESPTRRETDMGIDETLVQEIVRRILSVAQPDRIILFGSAATGAMTRDSDIDLLVVMKSPEHSSREYGRLRGSLRGIIVVSTERFEEMKDIIGGIEYPANKHGRVIYDAA